MTARIYISPDMFNKRRINVYAEDTYIGYYERTADRYTAKSISGKEMEVLTGARAKSIVKAFLSGAMPKEIKASVQDNDQLNLF